VRVLLCPCGSRGDVQPLVALAERLIARGHEVRLVGAPNAAGQCQGRGVPFEPMGLDFEAYLPQVAEELTDAPVRVVLEFARLIPAQLDVQFDVLSRHAGWPDVVLGAGIIHAAHSVAQASDAPYFFVAYTAQMLRSRHHPPFPFPYGWLPSWLNRGLWGLADRLFGGLGRGRMDRHRRALGLGPIGSPLDHFAGPGRVLLATDPRLSPSPEDFLPAPPSTGFWHLPQDQLTLPSLVEDFLQSGPKPLYLGFGSMTDPDPVRTTASALRAVRELGLRLVIASGLAGLGDQVQGDDVLVVPQVPHGPLLPRCVAAVHHGGSGTTAAVARAGIPQLVVPHLADQHYFGHRVTSAGLGPERLSKRRFHGRQLVPRLQRLVSDPDLALAARDHGVHARAQDGLARAVAVLEGLRGRGYAL